MGTFILSTFEVNNSTRQIMELWLELSTAKLFLTPNQGRYYEKI